MRIVMLTDDALNVDRRILLEAETLIDLGHEVIVLARADGNTPSGSFYGRVKVEFVKSAVPVQNNIKVWELPFISFFNHLEHKYGFGSRLKVFARQLMHYRKNIGKYFFTQFERIFDGWIPITRRIGILLRTIIMFFMLIAFKIVYSIIGLFHFSPKLQGIGNFLDHPFKPHAWDSALIYRGKFYRPDLIIAHDLPQLFAGAAIKKDLKIPLIYDSHEVYSEIGTLNKKEKNFLKLREKKFINKCDVMITVNPCAAEWFEKEYNIKAYSITNATDLPKGFSHNEKHDLIRKKLKLGKDIKILSYQGWFSTEGRGLQELIEAMKYVRKDVHLTMMGYGDFDFFRNLIDKHGVTGRVHLMEAVPWQELLWWSASADVGIVPYQPVDFNHVICSPNKIFEFIAARLPMLVNDLKYLRIVTEDTGFGIARKMTNPIEMSNAINEMFDEKLGHIAKAKAKLISDGEEWEWKNEAKKYLRYIDKELHYLDKKIGADSHLVKAAQLPEVTIPKIMISNLLELEKPIETKVKNKDSSVSSKKPIAKITQKKAKKNDSDLKPLEGKVAEPIAELKKATLKSNVIRKTNATSKTKLLSKKDSAKFKISSIKNNYEEQNEKSDNIAKSNRRGK